MFAHLKSERISNNNIILDYIKGIIVAMLISLGLVILFAFCLKWFELDNSFLSIGTLIIKAISVFFGGVVAVKGESKGLIKGVLFGIIYIVFALVVFSFLAGSFSVGVGTLLDLVFAVVLGGIVGIIKVNRASKS